MARQVQSGFTLIELSLVMAITGLLLVIAFTGQTQIRQRAEFDAAVNQLVQTVGVAKTDAAAALNTTDAGANVGEGVNGGACAGGNPANPYAFAGTVWSVDNNAPGNFAEVTIDYYKAEENPVTKDFDGVACRFETTNYTIPYDLTASNVPANQPGGRIIFAKTNTGGLEVCQYTNMSNYPTSVDSTFGAAVACTPPAPMVLTLTDTVGHTSQVQIDASGLGERLN